MFQVRLFVVILGRIFIVNGAEIVSLEMILGWSRIDSLVHLQFGRRV